MDSRFAARFARKTRSPYFVSSVTDTKQEAMMEMTQHCKRWENIKNTLEQWDLSEVLHNALREKSKKR